MKSLLAFLMLTTAAQGQPVIECKYNPALKMAQCLPGPNWLAKSTDYPLTTTIVPSTTSTATTGNISVTNAPRPQCDENWSLVSTGAGYKCARELREPK